MLIVEIKSVETKQVEGISKLTGKPFSFPAQSGFIGINGEVRRLEFGLGTNQAPYKPGRYRVADSTFTVNRYGRLEVDRLVLEPQGAPA